MMFPCTATTTMLLLKQGNTLSFSAHKAKQTFSSLTSFYTVQNMTSTYDQDAQKSVFGRLNDMRLNAEVTIKVMSLWIWLKFSQSGFDAIFLKISSTDDRSFTSLVDEAKAILSYLYPHRASSSSSSSSSSSLFSLDNLMRFTVNLSAEPFMSPYDIFADKEKVWNTINEICTIIRTFLEFKDELGERGAQMDARPGAFKLNPFAREWNPTFERRPEQDRCLFLTFSNGNPLSERQITRFFTRRYGACVEEVYVHWSSEPRDCRTPPLFGKIIFNTICVPNLIMANANDHAAAKFYINGKPLWCKWFDPSRSDNIA